MKRREFISLLSGAAATPLVRPHLAMAQQGAPVVGVLYGGPRVPTGVEDAAMRKGLNEQGYAEGRNLVIEYRATDQPERLPALALELVRRQVTVIAARSTINTAQAAMAATTTIPIVFANGSDPVRVWPRCKPQPTGRQRHRGNVLCRCAHAKAARTAA
jgi:putative ABC transport system substrate-binding protein